MHGQQNIKKKSIIKVHATSFLNSTFPCWPDDGLVTAETCSQI